MLAKYSFARNLPWSVMDILSDILLEKIDFPIPRRYIQIANSFLVRSDAFYSLPLSVMGLRLV